MQESDCIVVYVSKYCVKNKKQQHNNMYSDSYVKKKERKNRKRKLLCRILPVQFYMCLNTVKQNNNKIRVRR